MGLSHLGGVAAFDRFLLADSTFPFFFFFLGGSWAEFIRLSKRKALWGSRGKVRQGSRAKINNDFSKLF